MKFNGSIDELKSTMANQGYHGHWSEEGSTHRFDGSRGEVVKLYANRTLQTQGKCPKDLLTLLEELCGGAASSSMASAMVDRMVAAPKPADDRKIFVVHGHDRDAREQLELVLLRLGLKPFILQNQDAGGKTLVEALEQRIYDKSSFGIILMTPDDFGYAKDSGEEGRQPRARQNVVLEMGMVMAALGRDRMVILKKGELELPSDVSGVVYLGFNGRVQEIVAGLVKRLKAAGIEIDDAQVADAGA